MTKKEKIRIAAILVICVVFSPTLLIMAFNIDHPRAKVVIAFCAGILTTYILAYSELLIKWGIKRLFKTTHEKTPE